MSSLFLKFNKDSIMFNEIFCSSLYISTCLSNLNNSLFSIIYLMESSSSSSFSFFIIIQFSPSLHFIKFKSTSLNLIFNLAWLSVAVESLGVESLPSTVASSAEGSYFQFPIKSSPPTIEKDISLKM